MHTFDDLYNDLIVSPELKEGGASTESLKKRGFDAHQLDCLLHPDKYAPVWRVGQCDCNDTDSPACVGQCLFDAMYKDEKGNIAIDPDRCVGCRACIEGCKAQKLADSKDTLPVLAALDKAAGPVFALIAPAFIGQFSEAVTPGMLRSAFKKLGFAGMVEVALFADILTLKEAMEFDRTILTNEDFLITSCCCPIWIAMIRKLYTQLIPHVPAAVSPMVACGRAIKLLEPDSVTVFVGPCVAKKAEAREADIADAVDYVLTFEEIRTMFDVFSIDPLKMQDDPRDHSSRAGRIYARTGGVSEAVQLAVDRLNPNRKISVVSRQADGVPACKDMLGALKSGHPGANFLEGMGCVGGCVGGPKAILGRIEGREHVNTYGAQATHISPIDNPYVMDLLHRLGIDTVEQLLDDNQIFTRHF